MITNPSHDTNRATPVPPAAARDLRALGERFEKALRDCEERGARPASDAPTNDAVSADVRSRDALARDASTPGHDDDPAHGGDEHDADAIAAAQAALAAAAPLQALSSAKDHVAADASLASATQGAIGAGLRAGTSLGTDLSANIASSMSTSTNDAASLSLMLSTSLSPSSATPGTWSLTLPGLEAWSVQATQPHPDGAWRLDLTAPHASATPFATTGAAAATADASTLAAQAQVLAQRVGLRDVAVDRVTLRRRGSADAADAMHDDSDRADTADTAVANAVGASRGHDQRG